MANATSEPPPLEGGRLYVLNQIKVMKLKIIQICRWELVYPIFTSTHCPGPPGLETALRTLVSIRHLA